MKTKSFFISISAAQAHLGLNKKIAIALDNFCKDINLQLTSVGLTVWPDGQFTISVIDNLYPANGSLKHGVTVFHKCDFDHDGISISLNSAWDFVKKGAPDTGHIVYCITTYSHYRLFAMRQSNGLLPMPTLANKEILDSQRNGSVPSYIGMTSKGAAVRLQQHIVSACNGSMTKFHRVLRGDKYTPQIPNLTVISSLPSRAEAFIREEKEIKDACALDGVLVLNTAISSNLALNDLYEKFKIKENVDAEYAEEMLAKLSDASKLNWQDPNYAEAVICNNDRNLDADDVREIRMLTALGMQKQAIAQKLNINVNKVSNVIARKTYSRII